MSDDLERVLGEVEARALAAHPGPWEVYGCGPAYGVRPVNRTGEFIPHRGTATFIAHARRDVPRLVAALREAVRGLDCCDQPGCGCPGSGAKARILALLSPREGGA